MKFFNFNIAFLKISCSVWCKCDWRFRPVCQMIISCVGCSFLIFSMSVMPNGDAILTTSLFHDFTPYFRFEKIKSNIVFGFFSNNFSSRFVLDRSNSKLDFFATHTSFKTLLRRFENCSIVLTDWKIVSVFVIILYSMRNVLCVWIFFVLRKFVLRGSKCICGRENISKLKQWHVCACVF